MRRPGHRVFGDTLLGAKKRETKSTRGLRSWVQTVLPLSPLHGYLEKTPAAVLQPTGAGHENLKQQ